MNSIMDLVVFVPVIFVGEPNINSPVYFFVIISRYTRIIIFTNTLSQYWTLGDTDVDR